MTELEAKALDLCLREHEGQFDKSGRPYAGHPIRVAESIHTATAAMFCAALLHDTVEDCEITLDFIRAEFGEEVANAVDALTRRKSETYKAFIERCSKNVIARRVKLADIEDNLQPWRVSALEPKEAKRLRDRYETAHEFLEAAL